MLKPNADPSGVISLCSTIDPAMLQLYGSVVASGFHGMETSYLPLNSPEHSKYLIEDYSTGLNCSLLGSNPDVAISQNFYRTDVNSPSCLCTM